MHRFRPRLSYANVVATLALFVALGGTTYAAATIGASDIKQDAVRSRHIKNGAVKAADVDPGLVASLRLHCPSGLQPAGDLCFEPTERTSHMAWQEATKICARAQLRLPNAGELALVFDHLGAHQPQQWVANAYFDANGPDNSGYGGVISSDGGRNVFASKVSINSTDVGFRCVTSATNAR